MAKAKTVTNKPVVMTPEKKTFKSIAEVKKLLVGKKGFTFIPNYRYTLTPSYVSEEGKKIYGEYVTVPCAIVKKTIKGMQVALFLHEKDLNIEVLTSKKTLRDTLIDRQIHFGILL